MVNKHSYLSGYIDGDGCFYVRTYIQKPKNILVFDYSIQICSVCKDVIKYFYQEFGGTYVTRPEKRSNRKETYLWTIKTKKCLEVCKEIQEFLISKNETCSLVICLGSSIAPNKGLKVSRDVIEKRLSLINLIKEDIHMNDLIDEEKFNCLKTLNQSIEPTQEDYAYFAGLTDAEGCFRIQHWKDKRKGRGKNYVITFEIGNTKYPIFPWIIRRFGGNIVYRKPTKKQFNPMVIWSLRSKALYPLLEKIYPFLRVKKERCKKLMEFHEIKIPSGDRNSEEFRNKALEIQSQREFLLEEFHVLNAKGRH